MKHEGRIFNSLREILNFCEIANTQSLILELAILRIDNAIEVLSKTQPLIPCEDRVVAEFLRNADQKLSGLKKERIPIRKLEQNIFLAFFANQKVRAEYFFGILCQSES